MRNLAQQAINCQINTNTTRASHLPKILSDLHRNIVSVFNENGVEIMAPSYIAGPDVPNVKGHMAQSADTRLIGLPHLSRFGVIGRPESELGLSTLFGERWLGSSRLAIASR